VLYNALSTYDRSALYSETYVDAAVDRLNVPVTHATKLAVRSRYVKKHKYPTRFSAKLKACIKTIIVLHVEPLLCNDSELRRYTRAVSG
jgi:hypothetical protein